MKTYDLELISKIVMILLIGSVVVYALFGAGKFSENNTNGQTEKIEQLIDKALVQCYALEGSYPSNNQFSEKMVKYGVIMDEDKYIYHYEILGSNIKPIIKVMIRR